MGTFQVSGFTSKNSAFSQMQKTLGDAVLQSSMMALHGIVAGVERQGS